jgi:hypothetical protein
LAADEVLVLTGRGGKLSHAGEAKLVRRVLLTDGVLEVEGTLDAGEAQVLTEGVLEDEGTLDAGEAQVLTEGGIEVEGTLDAGEAQVLTDGGIEVEGTLLAEGDVTQRRLAREVLTLAARALVLTDESDVLETPPGACCWGRTRWVRALVT